MQRVDDVASVVPDQPTTPFVVVGMTGVAEVCDGLVGARGIFSREHVRFAERHGNRTAGTDSIPPVEPKIRLVSDGIEATASRERDMPLFEAAWSAHVTKLDMIARTTIAIHPAAKFLAAGAGLHNATTHLTVSDFTDA